MESSLLLGRLLCLALAVFLVDAYLQQRDESSNARTRFALTRAIVEEGRLTIDSYHEGIWDKALFQGHYYCDKAPLLSFLAVPVYAAVRAAGIESGEARRYFTRLFTVSLATAASLPLFGLWLRSRGIPDRDVLATCAAGWLASPLLPYGLVFFGHAVTFVLLVSALVAGPGRPLLSGLLLGLAVTSDYQAAVIAGAVGAATLGRRDLRGALALVAGALPPLLLLLAYHQALFGDPFTLPVRYEVELPVHNMDAEYSAGFYGMSLPKPRALWLLLASPAKGLLFLSPFFLLLVLATRRPRTPLVAAWATAWLVVPLYLAFITSIPSYHGGFSFGPRLLIPLLPYLLVLLAIAAERTPADLRRLAAVTGAGSFLVYLGASATVVAIPYDRTRPLTEVILPSLLAGELASHAGELIGLPGTAGLLPLLLAVSVLVAIAFRPAGSYGGGQAPQALT